MRRRAFFEGTIAGASALLAFGLYWRTLAPGLLGGDSGEFQFAAWVGGFAHPTGYPLYLLLGRLWTHLLPLGDPAWRMNLFSAFWGATTVGLFYGLARQVLEPVARPAGPWAGRAAALSAAALCAVTPTFWSQAVIAEVYTLNAALLMALLWALTRWAATKRTSWLYAAAFLFGLGLAHHRTTLLWLPAIVLFGWWVGRRGLTSRSPSLKGQGEDISPPLAGETVGGEGVLNREKALLLALLVGLPLLLYAYIPLTAPRAPYLHVQVGPEQTLELYTPTVAGFFEYVTGRTFESEFRPLGDALARAPAEARRLAVELTWPGILLGLIGLGWLARRGRPFLALTGLGFVILFVFNLFYGIGDIAVYYIPLYLIGSLWIAVGSGGLVAAVASWVARRCRPAPTHPLVTPPPSSPFSLLSSLSFLLLSLLPAFLAAHLLVTHFPQVDQSHNNQARATWQAILAQEIPPHAILVTNDRDEMMPFWYMQYVEGVRPDLTGLFPLIRPEPAWADVGMTIETAFRSGRPVLLIKEMPGLEVKFDLAQQPGGLPRVLGPATRRAPDRPADATFGSAIRLIGFDVEPAMFWPGAAATINLYWQPLQRIERDYTTFVHVINAEGRVIGGSDYRPGGVYYPSSLWKPAEVLRDTHRITLAADIGRPPYALEAGLYTAEPTLRHLGEPQRVGVIGRAQPAGATPSAAARRLAVVFGEQIVLRGYEVDALADRLVLRFYWEALQAPAVDYTVFVHLLDRADRIVAQYDGQPRGGELPTRAWPVGYPVADAVTLALPPLPADTYRLVVGLYDAATGRRLAVPAAADGRFLLGEVVWPAGSPR